MYSLTVMAAHDYTRRAIDELLSIDDIGMLSNGHSYADTVNLHKLVEGFLVEAVIKTYNQTPSAAMEGVFGEEGRDFSLSLNDGVVTIVMNVPVFRILSARCGDSEHTLGELIPENSAEGRKQLNKYIRGTYDDPRLVLLEKWNGDNMPRMKYYTTREEDVDDVSFDIEYLPYPELTEGYVLIAPQTKYAVLNNVVALVLDSYRETELADRFRNKSKELLEG